MIPTWIYKNARLKYAGFAIPLVGYLIGRYVTKQTQENMRSYHNKSALFGGKELKEGERVW